MSNIRIKWLFLFFISIFSFCFGKDASAATYYMRADGTAVSKAAATSCASAATSMSIATHNASTFVGDDIIYVCDSGGQYTSELTNPSSGTAGHPISYIASGTPTWNMAARNWYTNGKDYLVIDGMTFITTVGYSLQATTSDNSIFRNITSTAATGIYIQTCVSPTLENITSTTTSSSDGIRISGSNATITNMNVISSPRYGIYLDSTNGATITGGTVSNTQFEGIRIVAVNNAAISINGTSLTNVGLNGGATSSGIYYSGGSATGTNLAIANATISGALGLGGIYLTTAPFETNRATISGVNVSTSAFGVRGNNTNNVDITNSTFLNNTGDGIYFEGTSSGAVISNSTVGNNARDGISFGTGTINGTVHHNNVYGSGQSDVVSNGDGITTHEGCTGFSFYYNRIWGNRNSGFALVGAGSGTIYNNTVYFNGDSTSVNMGVRGGFYNSGTGGVYNFKNNILAGNYPNELNIDLSSVYSASTFDYNQYYHIGNAVTETSFSDVGSGLVSWAIYNASNETHSRYGNPLFANPSIGNFATLTDSPVINKGIAISGLHDRYPLYDLSSSGVSLTNDAGGGVGTWKSSLFGSTPDIGAYDFQDNTAPSSTADVDMGLYNSAQSVSLTCDDGSGSGCNAIYYTLDGVDPTTSSLQYSTPLVIASTTTLKFFSQDKNGNSELTIHSKTYTIDTLFPDTSIDSYPAASIESTSAAFTFSASETATFQCKIDSEAYASCSSPKNYTSLSEGTHTFYVKASDTATNEDATPASYSFVVDTVAPVISSVAPNSTSLAASTTSTSITLVTNESATCKYSATSGTDYASMTIFESTGGTAHSTLVTGLSAGSSYTYSMRCKDAFRESSETSISFSVAALEADAPALHSIKIKIERETNKFKDRIYSWKKSFKLKNTDSALANGTVKIYKDGKKVETLGADINGEWSHNLKLKNNFSGWVKVRQYDQYGTFLESKKVKVKIDTEKPRFSDFFLPLKAVTAEVTNLDWEAMDNDAIEKYKIYVGGKIYTTKYSTFQIPRETAKGVQYIKIKAYDKAGNTASKETYIRVQ